MYIEKSLLWRRRPRQRACGEPVLVVPGFGTSDAATVLLRSHLQAAGFEVHTWNLGINTGPNGDLMRRLSSRVRAIPRKTQQHVRLVGWSLGGLMARMVAGRLPRHVGRIVTLGAPLTADPESSHLARVYGWLGGVGLDTRAMKSLLREGARAPVTSIYSRNDGVVAWEASADGPGACRSIEVDTTHMGMIVDPDILEIVSREVARAPEETVTPQAALPAPDDHREDSHGTQDDSFHQHFCGEGPETSA